MPGHILDANTVALWRLTETEPAYANLTAYRTTEEANGNYDLLSTTAGLTPWPQGGPLQAMGIQADYSRFVGGTSYGRDFTVAGDGAAQAVFTGAAWTVEAWVYLDIDPSLWPASCTIVEYRGNSEAEATNGLMNLSILTDGTVRMFWERAGGINVLIASTDTVPIRQWVHVAVVGVENGADRDCTFYIDGVADGPYSDLKATGGTSASWYIGRNRDNTNQVPLSIAYVRVSSIERSSGQIAAAAASPTAITNDGDTLAFWPLQDPADHVDVSRNGYHINSERATTGATLGTTIFGVSGPIFPLSTSICRELTGSASDQGSVPARSELIELFLGNNEYTVELWVNTLEETSQIALIDIGGGGESLDQNFALSFRITALDELVVFFETGAGSDTTLTSQPYRADIPRETSRWTHLALRKRAVSGTQSEWDFFVDGQFFETVGPADDPIATGFENESTYFVTIFGDGEYQVSDTRISSIARTDEEILESFTRGVGEAIGPAADGSTPLEYFMRARNAANSAYVFWTNPTPDFAASAAPESVLPGSAIVLGVRRNTRLIQIVGNESDIMQLVDAPATAQDPAIGRTVVVVDTSDAGWPSGGVITLPASPQKQACVVVKDGGGNATAKSISVSGNGNDIDGESSMAITLSYGSLEMLFSGSEWKVV